MTKALQDEAEKIKEELAALTSEGEEFEDEEHVEEAVEEEPEAAEEPEKEEPKEEKLDDAGYARLRREKDAEKRRADELERKIAELSAPKQTASDEGTQTEQPSYDHELEQIKLENRYNAAEKVIVRMEQEFKENAPVDYDDVSMQYKAAVYNSIRLDPAGSDLSHTELLDATRKRLLEIAASHKSKGYNPIEKMYIDGKKLGFGPLPKQEQAVEKELKPDLSKIAANKKRNAGTAGAKGAGDRGQMTPVAMSELSAKDYAKIPASERKRVLDSLKGVA